MYGKSVWRTVYSIKDPILAFAADSICRNVFHSKNLRFHAQYDHISAVRKLHWRRLKRTETHCNKEIHATEIEIVSAIKDEMPLRLRHMGSVCDDVQSVWREQKTAIGFCRLHLESERGQ